MAEHGDPANRAELLLTLMGLQHEVAVLPLGRTAFDLGELPFDAALEGLNSALPTTIESGLVDQDAPETAASAQSIIDRLSQALGGTTNESANEALVTLAGLLGHAEAMRDRNAEAAAVMGEALVAIELAAALVKYAESLTDAARSEAAAAMEGQAAFDTQIGTYIDGIT
ncbi:MAG TPA: hypothetical protein VLH86_06095 [Patescibacteria group bacterium]|nr:hypothetical protein [Patescibacteria group bacterium]